MIFLEIQAITLNCGSDTCQITVGIVQVNTKSAQMSDRYFMLLIIIQLHYKYLLLQLYYISSAVSLYFPYDFCLYPGMTALVSYSLRYIPLLLTVIISTILYGANRWIHLYVHHYVWMYCRHVTINIHNVLLVMQIFQDWKGQKIIMEWIMGIDNATIR